MPHISGDTMFDKKEYMEQHMDEIRTMILFEPCGCPFHYDAGVSSFSNSLLQIYPFKKTTYYFL